MDRKKELKRLYKEYRPDMGVFLLRCGVTGRVYLKQAADLRAAMNGARARLGGGLHLCRELQQEWNTYGEEAFTFETPEKLEYDKDESKTDYTEELELLRMLWEDRLTADGTQLYRDRPGP